MIFPPLLNFLLRQMIRVYLATDIEQFTGMTILCCTWKLDQDKKTVSYFREKIHLQMFIFEISISTEDVKTKPSEL